MENKPVYIFSGIQDSVVEPSTHEQVRAFYEMVDANIYFDEQDYHHRVPRTEKCVEEDNEWVLSILGDFVGNGALRNCGYDMVGEMFGHLLGNSLVDPVEL